jgi:hypothetical protein
MFTDLRLEMARMEGFTSKDVVDDDVSGSENKRHRVEELSHRFARLGFDFLLVHSHEQEQWPKKLEWTGIGLISPKKGVLESGNTYSLDPY